jgi:hypothetical protein
MSYTMRVVEIASGMKHELPADAVTRDVPTPARGALVPLAFRPAGDAFYVSSGRWPELTGKALRLGF